MNETLGVHYRPAGDFPTTGTAQEKLRFLLEYAVLAPSSHNSQPWLFRLAADHVDLIADRSRALPVIDPQDRELLISCGAALGHLQIALRRFGYAGEVQTFPNPTDRDLLARVGLGQPHVPDAHDESQFQSLFARHTNRKPFRPERVPAEVLTDLDWLEIPPQVWLKVVPDGKEREALANLIAHADRDQVADCRFRRELAHWIRSNEGSSPQPNDGIPGASLGMPGLIADIGPFLVRTFDTGVLFAARDKQLAINSPLLIVLGSKEDTPADWLAVGQALSTLLLATTAEGISASFLNAPIEVAELRSQVGQVIEKAGYPQMILRLGYSDPAAPTPRRSPAECTAEGREGTCL